MDHPEIEESGWKCEGDQIRMKIDPKKLTVNEARSNPMAVALESPDCPIKGVCVFIVVGFGTVADQCNCLKINGGEMECMRINAGTPPNF